MYNRINYAQRIAINVKDFLFIVAKWTFQKAKHLNNHSQGLSLPVYHKILDFSGSMLGTPRETSVKVKV